MQAKLRSAPLLVQLLVIHGPGVLGVGTNNVSACIISEIVRVRDIVRRLGALLSGSPFSCCCEEPLVRGGSAKTSPLSWMFAELCFCFVFVLRVAA